MTTLYATDLDGTLLGTNKELSDVTVEKVNALIEKGMLFSIITARALFSVRDMIRPLHLQAPVAVMNGAAIYDFQKNRFVHTFPIPQDEVWEVIHSCRDQGLTPMVFVRQGDESHVYYDSDPDPIVRRLLMEMAQITSFYHRVDSLEEALKDAEVVVIESAGVRDRIRTVYHHLRDDSDVNLVSYEDVYGSGYHHVEVFSGSTNKGIAAKFIAEYMGAQRLVTFGDNYSDIDMFTVSDDSYAMENGLDEAKEAAHHIIGHCDEDAVALCLEKIF